LNSTNFMETLALMNKSLCINNNSEQTPINCLLQLNQQLLPSGIISNLNMNNIELTFDRSLLNQQAILYRYEIASVVLALLTICIKYGNVFWYTNKYLSFLVTFVFSLASVQQLLQLYSFWFIAKQIYLLDLIRHAQSGLLNDQRGVVNAPIAMHMTLGGQRSLLAFNFLLIDSYTKLLFFYLLLNALCLFTATPVYAFAYSKYRERLRCEESMFIKTMSAHANGSPDKTVKSLQNSSSAGCCFNYCPHLIATVQLIVICALKLPFCYDYIIYFNHLKDYGIMVCIIVEILHTIILLFIWLLLTLKIGKQTQLLYP
jgi:hypothetical protein